MWIFYPQATINFSRNKIFSSFSFSHNPLPKGKEMLCERKKKFVPRKLSLSTRISLTIQDSLPTGTKILVVGRNLIVKEIVLRAVLFHNLFRPTFIFHHWRRQVKMKIKIGRPPGGGKIFYEKDQAWPLRFKTFFHRSIVFFFF